MSVLSCPVLSSKYFDLLNWNLWCQKKNYTLSASIYTVSAWNYVVGADILRSFLKKLRYQQEFPATSGRDSTNTSSAFRAGWWLFNQTGKISYLFTDNKCNLNSVFRLLMYFYCLWNLLIFFINQGKVKQNSEKIWLLPWREGSCLPLGFS